MDQDLQLQVPVDFAEVKLLQGAEADLVPPDLVLMEVKLIGDWILLLFFLSLVHYLWLNLTEVLEDSQILFCLSFSF